MPTLTETEIKERSKKIKLIQLDFRRNLSLLLKKQLAEIEDLLQDLERGKIEKLRKSLK